MMRKMTRDKMTGKMFHNKRGEDDANPPGKLIAFVVVAIVLVVILILIIKANTTGKGIIASLFGWF